MSYTEENVLVVDGTVKKEIWIESWSPDKNYANDTWFYVYTDNDGDNGATLMELKDPFSELSTEILNLELLSCELYLRVFVS